MLVLAVFNCDTSSPSMGGNGCAFFFCFVGLRSGGHGFCICLFEFCPKANDRDNGFYRELGGPAGPECALHPLVLLSKDPVGLPHDSLVYRF